MGIGLSGMISGMDTDSIVQAMVSAQRTKSTKIENKITLNKWTTEAWSGLNTKIYSFYTKYASKLRLQSSFMTRTAKSSNEDVATATAGSNAAVGTHTLQINKLASSQYVTSGKLAANDKNASYNKNSKLTQIGAAGVAAGTIITITGKKGTEDEVVKKLEVTDKTTVNDFLNACKDAGLTANFDEKQQRFFISSSQSGSKDAFSITTAEMTTTARDKFTEIEKMVNTSVLSSAEKTAYEEAMVTLRENMDVIDDVLPPNVVDTSVKKQKAVQNAINVIKNAVEKTDANKDAVAVADGEIKAALTSAKDTPDAKIKYKEKEIDLTYNGLKTSAAENLEKGLVSKADKAANEAVKDLKFEKDASKGYVEASTLTLEKYEKAKELVGTKNDITEAEIDASTELTDAEKKELKNAYAVVNTWEAEYKNADGETHTIGATYEDIYDNTYTEEKNKLGDMDTAVSNEIERLLKENQKDVYNTVITEKQKEILDAENTDKVNELLASVDTKLSEAIGSDSGVTTSANGISALGLGNIDGNAEAGDPNDSTKMVVVAAADCEYVLDGATMTETSNNFTVNGITLNFADTTLDEETNKHKPIQITVGKDADSSYKLVKEALTEYNKLIEEMNKLYNADSARGYDPLTDEQKEAMTEDDIKNWEDKIKSSLLRRDDSLGSLLTSMRSALSSTYTDEDSGKTYSLSTFGIVTGNYTEKGKLHIYGDEDDATYATYEDRLKKALEEDPDQVMEVLTSVFGKLYDTMTEKCAKTEISSALTFYNDKQYKNLLSGYEDDLDKMEDRIKDLEDKYYKQFTAMETALSKLQSQTNSLASLLGSGTAQ